MSTESLLAGETGYPSRSPRKLARKDFNTHAAAAAVLRELSLDDTQVSMLLNMRQWMQRDQMRTDIEAFDAAACIVLQIENEAKRYERSTLNPPPDQPQQTKATYTTAPRTPTYTFPITGTRTVGTPRPVPTPGYTNDYERVRARVVRRVWTRVTPYWFDRYISPNYVREIAYASEQPLYAFGWIALVFVSCVFGITLCLFVVLCAIGTPAASVEPFNAPLAAPVDNIVQVASAPAHSSPVVHATPSAPFVDDAALTSDEESSSDDTDITESSTDSEERRRAAEKARRRADKKKKKKSASAKKSAGDAHKQHVMDDADMI